MENLTYILFISMCIPLAMMAAMLEGKSQKLILFMLMGILMCLLASEINPILASMISQNRVYVTTNITPIVEEVLKGLPILFYAYVFWDDKQSLLEVSMAVGIGFALLENAWILIKYIDSINLALAFVRGFGSALMHGVCCLFVGYGISFIRVRKKLFYSGIFAMLSVAIIYHSIYNSLVQSLYPMAGIVLPILTYIPLWAYLKFYKKEKKA